MAKVWPEDPQNGAQIYQQPIQKWVQNLARSLIDFEAILVDFGSQNGVKIGPKSNPTGTSPEKGAHHEYIVKTIEILLILKTIPEKMERNRG